MSAHSLVEQLKGGLDAPICLTWELTYACNLAVRPLPVVVGPARPARADHRRGQGGGRRAARLQVFYVNIGGGEPMIRRDFFELVELRDRPTGSASSSRPTARSSTPPKARRLAAMDYLDIQISLDGIDAATNDAVRGDGSYAIARRAMDHLARRRLRPVQDLRRRHPPQRRPARRVQGARRLVRRAAAGHPAAPVGPRRRHVARAAPDQRPAAPDLRLAARPRRRRADRRLVLPPQRARRAACPASTCAAPGGSCASSTRSATCTPARS